jgi:hypothetical protein
MEENLRQFGHTYSEGLWIATASFLILGLVRTYLVIKNKGTRKWIFNIGPEWFVIAMKAVFAIGLVFFLFDLPLWFLNVAQYRNVAPKLPQNALIFVLYFITIQELILSFTVSESLIQQFIKRMFFFLLAVFCTTSFILAAAIVPGTFQYPSVDESELLELPVKGEYLAMHAGGAKWINYHCNYPPQLYAIDIVKLNQEGDFFQNDGTDTTDFFTFGEKVFAPTNGKVYSLEDGFENQKVLHGEDSINPGGNLLVIDIGENKFLFLAHLQKGSFKVNIGDSVQTGQLLAIAGNSGNTSFPHLHMHIQNLPVLNDTLAQGLPFRFKKMERKRYFGWQSVENDFLIRNDKFKSN